MINTDNSNKKEKIIVFDTTLRDGEQASGFHMFPEEKLEIAKKLAELGVDYIEAGFAISSPGDSEAIYKICEQVTETRIASLARTRIEDIDAAAKALKPAIERGMARIHTFIATSDIHTEKKLRKSKEEIIEMAVNAIKHAKKYTPDIEFSTEDFGRSDSNYIIDIVTAAIQAGATTINLPDTVGYLIPREMYEKVKEVIEGIRKRVSLENITFSAHCHNDLGNATPHTCEAILAGVRQIEVTINGIGERAGNTAFEQVIANIKERGKYKINPFTNKPDPFLGLDISHIKTEKIGEVSKLVARFTGNEPQKNFPIIGKNAFSHEAGIHQDGMNKDRLTYEIMNPQDYGVESITTFGARSGRNALRAKYASLKINLTEEEFQEASRHFTQIADKTKETDDADAVRAIKGEEIPCYYQLLYFHPIINESYTALIKIKNGDKLDEAYSKGNGQIDAAINAIKKIVEEDYKLEEFSVVSKSPGSNALGITRIKASKNGWNVLGFGESTDIIKASIQAYINACNRLRYIEDFFIKI